MPNDSTTESVPSAVTTGSPIPLAYGYVWGTGKRLLYYQLLNTGDQKLDYTRVGMWALGHGEWDGCQELWINDDLIWTSENDDLSQFHFHRGCDAVIGSGLAPTSQGPDQGVDTFFKSFPEAVNRLTFNRMAYYSIYRKQPIRNSTLKQSDPTQWTDINPVGLWRGLRTRLFNDQGQLIGYSFTTNPAWHIIDVLLRCKIKPDYLLDLNNGPEDLNDAERARFDWGSIAESADYYDQLLANGRRRFTGNYYFGSQTSLNALLEPMLLVCRSSIQEYAGKIALVCDKPRASTFIFSRSHILPSSLEVNDQQAHQAPNRLVGRFRDLLVPVAATIQSITLDPFGNPIVTTVEPHPFIAKDRIVIGGTGTPYDSIWNVKSVPAGTSVTTMVLVSKGSEYPSVVGAGGKIGITYSRFKERAPEYNHKRHQRARGARGLNLVRARNKVKQELDFSTCTFDQVSRILKYERMRSLGADADPYVPPPGLTLRAPMFAIDRLGRPLASVHLDDRITLDDTATFPYAGDWLVQDKNVFPVTAQGSGDGNTLQLIPAANGGEVELILIPYNEDSFVEESDPEEAGWENVPESEPGNNTRFAQIDLEDGVLAFFTGSGASGSTLIIPSIGFNAANLLTWASAKGYIETGHDMNVIANCKVDSNRKLLLEYWDRHPNDSSSDKWHGDLNFAGLAWRGTSAALTTVGVMTYLLATLLGGEEVCFGSGVLADGASFALPAGFTTDKMFAIALPHDASVTSDSDAHGIEAYVDPSTLTVHLNYKGTTHSGDSPTTWHGNAAVLVFAWKNNIGTVTEIDIDGGKWMVFPLTNGKKLGVASARISNGSPLQLPSLTQPTVLATASVSVSGKSSPWSPTINPTYDFGVHDGTGPFIVPIAFAAGNIITIEATGTVDVSDGRPPYGPDGAGFVTGGLKGPNGTYFPTKHIPNASLELAGLCGSITDDAGVIQKTFAAGKRIVMTAPVGGTKLVLGVNDNQYSDNSGAFLANITITDTPPPEVNGTIESIPTQRSFVESGHHAHGVKACYVGSDNIVNMSYSDDAGHIWYGDAEVFAVLVQDAATEPVTVDVSPSFADVAAGAQQQFSAAVAGTLDKSVSWSVDDILGGNSAVGTVSTNGLYTAPTTGGVHTIKATSLADPAAFDTAPVNVVGAEEFGDAGSFVSASPKSAIKQLAGEATIIRNDAFSVTWSSGRITSYSARSFPISDPGATPVVKYVTIFDPNRTGDASGNLPAFIDDTAARALSSSDYVFVGKIIATQEGGNTGSVVGPDGLSQILATTGSSGTSVANPFGNNTSASSDYKWDSTDALIRSNFETGKPSDKSANPSPRNTSGRDVHELGASPATKWICHVMPWFGPSRPHISVGYNSDTDAQAAAQVAFLKARGVDIVQAYINPRDAFTYSAAQRLLAACVTQGMLFNLCYPGSSFKSGGSAQVISDFANFNTDFFGSSAYQKWGGRPVVFMFDSTGANWTTVRAGISGLSHGNPALIFRNKGGRTVTESQGCYGWNDPSSYDSSSDPGAISYLSDFYSSVNAAGAVAGGEFVCGSMYVGFKGVLTAGKNTNGGTGTGWSRLKFIARQFNKTWRQCAAAANAVFDASTSAKTLPFMLIDTLNDYEEGTAVEPGIPSGITIAAAIANNVITWSTVGDEGGVHQYVISRAPGGLTTPLTTIATVAVGATKSVDLSALAAGNYNVFVIAEGIPLVHNESATVAFTR